MTPIRNGAQMIVHLGRGHHDARPRLSDFASNGGVKIHLPGLSTSHQTSSQIPRVAKFTQYERVFASIRDILGSLNRNYVGWASKPKLTRPF